MNYYIFGAHSRARTVKEYLRVLEPSMHLAAYLYDNDDKNPHVEDDVQVVDVSGAEVLLDTGCPVYIGTRGVYHAHITEVLNRIGFTDIRPVNADLDIQMRNAYVRKMFEEKGIPFVKIDDLASCGEQYSTPYIYVIKSWFDNPVCNEPGLKPWENILQAGTEIAPDEITDAFLFDNEGDNISDRNRQFCELTGLYWMWKNSDAEIVGLEHYRRRFLLQDDWVARFTEANAEVILPVPLCVMPSVAENFCNRHDHGIWNTAMEAIKSFHPEDYDDAVIFFHDKFYSPCNMFIMRREVLNNYCSWLFPMLFDIAEKEGEKEDRYLNRYPGFIAERFLSFWCSKYIERDKRIFADKSFLG